MRASDPAPATPDGPVPADGAHQMRVLILDDNEIDRYRLHRMCRDAGLKYDLTEAIDLTSFRAALDVQAFDLVFIDYLLPGETGLEAVDILTEHANQAAAVAIMIAGEGMIDVAVEAMRNGCSDYLTKSGLSPEALQKSVAAAFERKLLVAAAGKERALREALESSVRHYASQCTDEMRKVLASMLRRVRMLRRFDGGTSSFGSELVNIEETCGDLWDAMTRFKSDTIASVGTGPVLLTGGDPAALAAPDPATPPAASKT